MAMRDEIKKILESEPVTRNNDMILFIRYIERVHQVQTLTQLKKLAVENKVNFDSIRRRRAEIQKSGLYPPSVPRRIGGGNRK